MKHIVANWKMNGSLKNLEAFVRALPHTTPHEFVWCPPFPLLIPCYSLIQNTPFKLGAQDCHEESSGSFTGDVSAALLKEIGCTYVIVGHLERRRRYSETKDLVTQKAIRALEEGLTPIVCVSELKEVPDLSGIWIAYEPAWAIGSGVSMDKEALKRVMGSFKKQGVLYGGSVDVRNAADLLEVCDGLLIGKASLDPKSLAQILGSIRPNP